MDIEVIQGLKGAPDAPNKGASGAPSTVQDLHPTTVSRVQVVHSKGAGGALKGAGGALPLPSPSPPEQPLTPIEQETRLEFDGHAEFHGIDGVDSSVCDNRCQHLANWVKKNPELAPNLADAAGSVADQVIYDPEGGKRMKPPAPWFYEGAKGKVRDADIVRVVLKWARYSRNGTARQATSSLDNTVESMRLAEEETRRGR